MSELSEAINEMRNMRESYNELVEQNAQIVEQNAQLAADVQAIKDAHILGFSYDGIIFEEGYEPRSAFGIIANRNRIIEVHDDRDTVIPPMGKADYPELEIFEMKNANTSNIEFFLQYWMANSTTLRKIIIPTYRGLDNRMRLSFRGMTNLNLIDMTDSIVTVSYHHGSNDNFPGCVNLIDIKYGRLIGGSTDALVQWEPSNALLDDSTSLLTQEDIAAGFENNRQKLLYNIREHIAANLTDRTGLSPYTITFSQSLRDIFDQDTEDAFAAKGWSIAPAKSV